MVDYCCSVDRSQSRYSHNPYAPVTQINADAAMTGNQQLVTQNQLLWFQLTTKDEEIRQLQLRLEGRHLIIVENFKT